MVIEPKGRSVQINFLIGLDKAAQKKGGRRGDPHVKRVSVTNHERYEFDCGIKADSFVKEVESILDNCSGGRLEKLIEKHKDKVVGQLYKVVVRMCFEGRIGRGLARWVIANLPAPPNAGFS